jgi:cysteinyl-tRNA synthetase
LANTILEQASVLGFLQDNPESFLQAGSTQAGQVSAAEIEQLIAIRLQAKQDKHWAEADLVRDDLKAKGVILEDVASGTNWRRE